MLLKRMNLNVSVRPVLVGLARKGAETDVQGHRASPRFYLLEITTANDRVLGPGGDREGSMAIEAIVAVFNELFNERKAPWLAFAIKHWNFPAAARFFMAFSDSILNGADSLTAISKLRTKSRRSRHIARP